MEVSHMMTETEPKAPEKKAVRKVKKKKHRKIEWGEGLFRWTSYQAENASGILPEDYHDKALIEWVEDQRKDYWRMKTGRSSFLDEHGFGMLTRRGFDWGPNPYKERDEEKAKRHKSHHHRRHKEKRKASSSHGAEKHSKKARTSNGHHHGHEGDSKVTNSNLKHPPTHSSRLPPATVSPPPPPAAAVSQTDEKLDLAPENDDGKMPPKGLRTEKHVTNLEKSSTDPPISPGHAKAAVVATGSPYGIQGMKDPQAMAFASPSYWRHPKPGYTKTSKAVKMINPHTGQVVSVFFSIRQAERESGLNRKSIGNALKMKGDGAIAGGYRWEYISGKASGALPRDSEKLLVQQSRGGDGSSAKVPPAGPCRKSETMDGPSGSSTSNQDSARPNLARSDFARADSDSELVALARAAAIENGKRSAGTKVKKGTHFGSVLETDSDYVSAMDSKPAAKATATIEAAVRPNHKRQQKKKSKSSKHSASHLKTDSEYIMASSESESEDSDVEDFTSRRSRSRSSRHPSNRRKIPHDSGTNPELTEPGKHNIVFHPEFSGVQFLKRIRRSNLKRLVPPDDEPALFEEIKEEFADLLVCEESLIYDKDEGVPSQSIRGNVKWEQHFFEFIVFTKVYGHPLVPKVYSENPSLGRWVHKNRQYRKNNVLSQSRTDRLNAVGFVWVVQRVPEPSKDNLPEPSNVTPKAAPTQPSNVTPKAAPKVTPKVTPDILSEVTEENYRFQSPEVRWKIRMDQLMDYKRKFGDCDVPKECPGYLPLSRWVQYVRRQYKNKQEGKTAYLNDQKEKQLHDVGFVFNPYTPVNRPVGENITKPKGFEDIWVTQFEQLKKFKDKYGHAAVPRWLPEDEALAKWCRRQRANGKKYLNGEANELTDEQFNKLVEIDFPFEIDRRMHPLPGMWGYKEPPTNDPVTRSETSTVNDAQSTNPKLSATMIKSRSKKALDNDHSNIEEDSSKNIDPTEETTMKGPSEAESHCEDAAEEQTLPLSPSNGTVQEELDSEKTTDDVRDRDSNVVSHGIQDCQKDDDDSAKGEDDSHLHMQSLNANQDDEEYSVSDTDEEEEEEDDDDETALLNSATRSRRITTRGLSWMTLRGRKFAQNEDDANEEQARDGTTSLHRMTTRGSKEPKDETANTQASIATRYRCKNQVDQNEQEKNAIDDSMSNSTPRSSKKYEATESCQDSNALPTLETDAGMRRKRRGKFDKVDAVVVCQDTATSLGEEREPLHEDEEDDMLASHDSTTRPCRDRKLAHKVRDIVVLPSHETAKSPNQEADCEDKEDVVVASRDSALFSCREAVASGQDSATKPRRERKLVKEDQEDAIMQSQDSTISSRNERESVQEDKVDVVGSSQDSTTRLCRERTAVHEERKDPTRPRRERKAVHEVKEDVVVQNQDSATKPRRERKQVHEDTEDGLPDKDVPDKDSASRSRRERKPLHEGKVDTALQSQGSARIPSGEKNTCHEENDDSDAQGTHPTNAVSRRRIKPKKKERNSAHRKEDANQNEQTTSRSALNRGPKEMHDAVSIADNLEKEDKPVGSESPGRRRNSQEDGKPEASSGNLAGTSSSSRNRKTTGKRKHGEHDGDENKPDKSRRVTKSTKNRKNVHNDTMEDIEETEESSGTEPNMLSRKGKKADPKEAGDTRHSLLNASPSRRSERPKMPKKYYDVEGIAKSEEAHDNLPNHEADEAASSEVNGDERDGNTSNNDSDPEKGSWRCRNCGENGFKCFIESQSHEAQCLGLETLAVGPTTSLEC